MGLACGTDAIPADGLDLAFEPVRNWAFETGAGCAMSGFSDMGKSLRDGGAGLWFPRLSAAADGDRETRPFPLRFVGNWRRTVDGRGIPPFHDRTVKGWGTLFGGKAQIPKNLGCATLAAAGREGTVN